MEKDMTIIELLERLKSTIDLSLLEFVDYWDADLCAIGLKRGDRLVYISTYPHFNKNETKYDFDLEIDNENVEKIEVVKVKRSVSEAELVDEMKLFLGFERS